MSALADIQRQVMWNRLIAVVEEQAQTMIRTAFSTTVREAGDLSAGIFDLQGRMLAQAVTGTPGHVNSHDGERRPLPAQIPAPTPCSDGDHLITNDPWLGTGHLHDLTVVTPAFHRGKLVALFANTAHVIDVGGLGMGPEGRSVFEEGLYIPIVKCFEAGPPERDLLRFPPRRHPPAGRARGRRLLALRLQRRRRPPPGRACSTSSASTASTRSPSTSSKAAAAPPSPKSPSCRAGRFAAEIWSDGYEAPVRLAAAMTIAHDQIDVDFDGTSGLSGRGINVPAAYTRAYASFGIKCVVAPEIPNNTASLAPFRMRIPEGCILNAPRPSPVSVRHVVGQLLPDLMMGCLHQAVPDRVTAEGSSCLWNPPLRGGAIVSGQNSPLTGFRGHHLQLRRHRRAARPATGWTAPPSPPASAPCRSRPPKTSPPSCSGARSSAPTAAAPAAPAAASARSWRSAPRATPNSPATPSSTASPTPRAAATAAATARPAPFGSRSGATLRTKGYQIIPAGDRLILELPGGGGMGPPERTRPRPLASDLRDELVTAYQEPHTPT